MTASLLTGWENFNPSGKAEDLVAAPDAINPAGKSKLPLRRRGILSDDLCPGVVGPPPGREVHTRLVSSNSQRPD